MGLAYDAARNRVVLFGGTDELGLLRDTWTWDGTDWTSEVLPTRPPREVSWR
jgi:hypothetical protein